MSFDDWVLALHVLSAFAWVAGLVLFSVLVVAVRRADTPAETLGMQPVARIGGFAVGIGAVGTIVLGVVLALSYGDHDLWDAWIVAAILLWLAAAALGSRTGTEYNRGAEKARELATAGRSDPSDELLALNRTSRGVLLHTATCILTLLILIDMIWKPGA